MNTNYVPVDPADLTAGDKVRLTHDNGDILHGTVESSDCMGLGIKTHAVWQTVSTARTKGYRFQRERPALPTERGWYALVDGSRHPEIIGVDALGWWVYGQGGHNHNKPFPGNAVRLVPAAEADELRARIEKALADVDTLEALLNGEA